MTKLEIKRQKARWYQQHREEILLEKKRPINRKKDRENKRRRYAADPLKYKKRAQDWRKKNPDRIKTHNRKSNYGVTQEWFDDRLKRQKNRCAVCLHSFVDTPHVDHCHKTKKNRGLLCVDCNLGLGRFKDSTRILRRAIQYLKEFENVDSKRQ